MYIRILIKPAATLLFVLAALFARAQYSEVGLMAGISNYKGELSEHLINDKFIHPAAGFFYRHNWNRHWSFKAELNYGRVSGDDSHSTLAFERDRNLSFYSDILEFSPQIEFNFFPYETGNRQYSFTPYIFTGLSVFHFNPKAELNGDVYELQPLGTEGQEFNGTGKYSRVRLALPIGGGLKFSIGRFGLGIEAGGRKAYTDYLDDVSTTYPDMATLQAVSGPIAVQLSDRSLSGSQTDVKGKQRGNPEDKDWYFFGGVTLYFRLTSVLKDVCKPFKKRRYN
jgi:hypothetical protein